MAYELAERATTHQEHEAERRGSLGLLSACSGEGTLTSSEISESSNDAPATLLNGSGTEGTSLGELDYYEYCNAVAYQSDYMIFRRFSTLNARVMLFMQKQLIDLETKLMDLDRQHFYNLRPKPSCPDDKNEREILIHEIEQKLLQYHTLAAKTAESSARPPALDKHINSLKELHAVRKLARTDPKGEDLRFFNQKIDLCALVPRYQNPLRKLFDRYYTARRYKFWQVPGEPAPDWDLEAGPGMSHINDRRVDRAIDVGTAIIGLATLLGPVWILAFINDLHLKLAVISAFVVLFTWTLGYASDGKSAEYLVVATAGQAETFCAA